MTPGSNRTLLSTGGDKDLPHERQVDNSVRGETPTALLVAKVSHQSGVVLMGALVRDTLSSPAPAGFYYEIGFLIRLSVLRNLIQAIPNMAVAPDQWRGHFSSPNCS
jgi:hypothetical protein